MEPVCGGADPFAAKAARPGTTDPAYKLRFASKIPIAKLKAAHRKVTTSRGKKSLTIDTPNDPAIQFRAIKREGTKFILLRAGPLPERQVGGVYTNPKTAFTRDGYPQAAEPSPSCRTGPPRGDLEGDQRPPGQEEAMTQIALIDDALVRLLESCSFPGVTVLSAPHEWDNGFIRRLVSTTPSVLISFLGAEQYDDTPSTVLQLAGKWGCYCVVGWNGADQQARRTGAGAGFDLMHRAAAAIHTAILTEPNGERLPQTTVEGLQVRSDSAVDISNLWIGEIAVAVELTLELQESDACYGPLDDFLKIRGPLVVPDPAEDVPLAVDLPQ